ncbi:CYFA0S01e19251g1_1 [Cyberlindnera fabianii]|uniref:CYFA0S01e19251g1_1 n=1 Tax=Cyberlindnera fabianii TaxID=36022 RepID=A0A061ARF1_CYBFA|nr:hypothetical protein BON22_1530 [Cyberlindnera fabianii]CDR37925.1 CYFA0S01e19251g1_1 [Cyberlindnera fabianii]
MKFFTLGPIAAVMVSVTAAESSESATYGQSITLTETITGNGVVYEKTRTELYTGQVTTIPTSGVATTVFTVSGSLATYTKTVVQTYYPRSSSNTKDSSSGSSSDTDTTEIRTTTISDSYETYTKTLTGDWDSFTTSDYTTSNAAAHIAGSAAPFVAGVAAFLLL